MKIIRKGSVERQPGPKQAFGEQHVEVEPLISDQVAKGIRVLNVHFFDGAKNKLHSHSAEQVLYCISGKGQVGTETKPWDVGPGDTVYIPAGEKHWHGAAPGEDFVHLAIHPPCEMVVFD